MELLFDSLWKTSEVWRCSGAWQWILWHHRQTWEDRSQFDPQHLKTSKHRAEIRTQWLSSQTENTDCCVWSSKTKFPKRKEVGQPGRKVWCENTSSYNKTHKNAKHVLPASRNRSPQTVFVPNCHPYVLMSRLNDDFCKRVVSSADEDTDWHTGFDFFAISSEPHFFYLLIENIEISYLSQHFIKMTKQWKNAADVPLTSPSPICCFSL